MRIYTRAGDLAFKTFTFPDGQPHFKLETYERDFQTITIETAIRTPTDLFEVLLASDVLRNHGYSEVRLDIRYLMGARMDRAISVQEPFTLQSVARLINGAGFSQVRILDVHSEVATKLIRNCTNLLPLREVEQVIAQYPQCTIIVPDKGARERVLAVSRGPSGYVRDVIYCTKERDPETGALSKFKVDIPFPCTTYTPFAGLIIDDICDGGRTFTGLAKALREKGATKVYLYVTHGIFSAGLPLEGIDHIYTTDSYTKPIEDWDATARGQDVSEHLTVIPVSMEHL